LTALERTAEDVASQLQRAMEMIRGMQSQTSTIITRKKREKSSVTLLNKMNAVLKNTNKQPETIAIDDEEEEFGRNQKKPVEDLEREISSSSISAGEMLFEKPVSKEDGNKSGSSKKKNSKKGKVLAEMVRSSSVVNPVSKLKKFSRKSESSSGIGAM